MRPNNPIYNDYRRRRARERWRTRVPLVAGIAAVLAVVLAIGVFVAGQVRARSTQPMASAQPLTPTPLQVAVMASATPTSAIVSTRAPLATPLPTATIASAASVAPAQQPAPMADGRGLDVASLQRLMLDLINTDRQANGLPGVEWDDSAASAAMAHAEDMAAHSYFSHWNTQGWGPDVRYGMAGGTDVIKENVAAQWSRYSDGRPAPIDDWRDVIREAQIGLMNSPGHRANILDPHHTHVGIGIAYNAQTGEARIAQEFINRYIALTPASHDLADNNEAQVSGTLLGDAGDPLINVAFEPLPQPLTPDDLNQRMPKTYRSPAETVDVVNPDVQREQFVARVPLGQNGPGLYHIRIWVKVNGQEVPASNIVVAIGQP